jgi:NADH:ubiquinone oxidoreductase subunit
MLPYRFRNAQEVRVFCLGPALDMGPAGWQKRPTPDEKIVLTPKCAAAMKSFLLKLFTWWNSTTFGTQFWTWKYGEKVGSDEFGNIYYRTKGGKIDPTLLFERRWVIYNGYAEASTVPPSWHGWLHHTVDTPPTKEDYQPREWQKPHRPNLTGTAGAYRPAGSTLAQGRRPKATGDYKAWSP